MKIKWHRKSTVQINGELITIVVLRHAKIVTRRLWGFKPHQNQQLPVCFTVTAAGSYLIQLTAVV